MSEEESKLKELKVSYEKIRVEHDLPSFGEMNEDFQIERIAELETDFLIREIRKFVADKLLNYMRFVETVLNPTNAPMFYFSLIKALNADDKKVLEEIYKKIVKLEIDLIELDTKYDLAKEVAFIKESFSKWQEVKGETIGILDSVKKNWDNKVEKNNGGYFG